MSLPTYLGLPVLTWEPDWTTSGQVTGARRTSRRQDAGVGRFKYESYYPSSSRTPRRLRYVFTSRQEVIDAKEVLEQIKGRCKTFWVPTWTDDLTLVEPCDPDQAALRITGVGYIRFYLAPAGGRRHLALFPGGPVPENLLLRKVTTATAETGGDETLTVNANLGVRMEAGDRISFLLLCRADSDRLTVTWEGPTVGTLELPTIDVPRETP